MKLVFSFAQPEHAKKLVQLVNSAYRGESSKAGWTTEADLLDGQRIDEDMIQEILEDEDEIILMALDKESKEIVGCVHLTLCQPEGCHLGMLTVNPNLQNSGVGAQLLSEAESIARSHDCKKMTMGVLVQRRELIEWYLRRGYQDSGKKEAFPYGNTRFGVPIRQDLEFAILDKTL